MEGTEKKETVSLYELTKKTLEEISNQSRKLCVIDKEMNTVTMKQESKTKGLGVVTLLKNFSNNANAWVTSIDSGYKNIARIDPNMSIEPTESKESTGEDNDEADLERAFEILSLKSKPFVRKNKSEEESGNSRYHDQVSALLGVVSQIGMIPIGEPEMVLVDPELKVSSSKKYPQTVIPVGVVDILLYDIASGELRVCEIKTTIKKYNETRMEKLFLKLQHVIQVEYYKYLLKRILKKMGSTLRVGNSIILGCDCITNRYSAWELEPSNSEYLFKGTHDFSPLLINKD
jgi:hypothetical protein